jgi:hypothetical protein
MPFENLMFFEFCMGPKTTKQGNTDTIGKKRHTKLNIIPCKRDITNIQDLRWQGSFL